MLDFYVISDEVQSPKYPSKANLEFVLGLDDRTFHGLISLGLIESKFDFYSDFRWEKTLVKQINLKILDAKVSNPDIQKFRIIIEKALEKESGLIAYCD